MNESTVRLKEAKTLPQGWHWAKLGEIGPVRDGDWILNNDYAPSGVRLLQVADIGVGNFADKSSRFITLDRARELNCTLLEPGDILISRMPDPIGRACQLPKLDYPCITAVDVSIWRPKNDIANRQYLTYYLNCSEWLVHVANFASGATRPRISRSNLENLEIPLPPLHEQKHIADKIQELMAEVERARTACEARLEAAKALPKAYLRQVFESEEAKKWEWRRLGEIAVEFVNGGTPSTGATEYWGGDIPWITGADVTNLWVSRGRKFITKEGLNNSATHLVDKGTILIVTRTGVGKVGIAANALCFSQDITGVICNIQVLPEYLARFLVFHQDQLVQIQRGATIKGLTRRDIESMEISLPSISEQNHIVAELEHKLTSTEKLKTDIEKQLEAIKALPQAILRKAFRGEL